MPRTSAGAMPGPTSQSPRRLPRISPDPVRRSGWTAWPRSTTTSAPRWTGRSRTARSSSRSGLTGAMWRFWQGRGHIEEGWATVQRVLAMPGADARTPGRLALLDAAGGVAWWMGDIDEPPIASTRSRSTWPAASVSRAASPTRCSTSATPRVVGSDPAASEAIRAEAIQPVRGDRRCARRGTGRLDRRECPHRDRPGGRNHDAGGPAGTVCRARRRVLRRDGQRHAVVEPARDGRVRRMRSTTRCGSFQLACEARDIGATTIGMREVQIVLHLLGPSATRSDPRGSLRVPEQPVRDQHAAGLLVACTADVARSGGPPRGAGRGPSSRPCARPARR